MSNAHIIVTISVALSLIITVANVIIMLCAADMLRRAKRFKTRASKPQETASGIEKRLEDLQRMRFGPRINAGTREK